MAVKLQPLEVLYCPGIYSSALVISLMSILLSEFVFIFDFFSFFYGSWRRFCVFSAFWLFA
jgi:hypothetical protein